jgi:purine-cytosine permease-like protein
MTTDPDQPEKHEVAPSRRDRLRPLELVGFAGGLAVFAGLIVLLILRTSEGVPDFGRAGIVAGIAFIVVLLVVALLGLGGKPSKEDLEARKDLQDPNSSDWH